MFSISDQCRRERLGWVLVIHMGQLSLAQSVSADGPSTDTTDAWKAACPYCRCCWHHCKFLKESCDESYSSWKRRPTVKNKVVFYSLILWDLPCYQVFLDGLNCRYCGLKVFTSLNDCGVNRRIWNIVKCLHISYCLHLCDLGVCCRCSSGP